MHAHRLANLTSVALIWLLLASCCSEPPLSATGGAMEPGDASTSEVLTVDEVRFADAVRAAAEEYGVEIPPVTQAVVWERALEIRRDALARAEDAERLAATEIAERVAAERAALEDPQRTRTMELLRRMKSDFAPPWRTLGDRGRMRTLFARRIVGPTVDGVHIDLAAPIEDGTDIVFPHGRFDLPVRRLAGHKRFPRDLLIRGAGMDETVVVLDGEIDSRDEVHNLTFRDVTIHANDNYLEQFRNEPYMLRLERCRVIGFDMGAGGSCMLGGGTALFYASDCRFEAAFGRSPGSGNLFDVRGGLAARLERCTFVGPFQSVHYQWPGAAHLFVDCRFEQIADPRTRDGGGAKTHDIARFENCTFPPQSEPSTKRPDRKPITDINADWGL